MRRWVRLGLALSLVPQADELKLDWRATAKTEEVQREQSG
jgi:hypothetical protein